MLLQLIIFLLLGILAGTITGLTPGIHINLIGSILISLSAGIFLNIPPIYLLVFIIAMSITHTFIDFIPSIYLGAPEPGTELSVLPGHRLLLEGNGHQAVILTLKGSLYAIFSIMLISPLLIFIFPKINNLMTILIPYILILISIFLIFKENKRIAGLFIFILAGILGLLVFNNSLNEPLLPLLSGLFGASNLFISIKNKTQIPKQEIKESIINYKKFSSPAILSLITSSVIGFLPGVSSSQAAIIASEIKKMKEEPFLFLLGATNTFIMIVSFLAFYTIGKTRTGSAAFIKEIFPAISYKYLFLIFITTAITGIFSYYLGISISRKISRNIHKINYSKISLYTLIFLSAIIFIFSGFLGFFIFVISGMLGVYCIQIKVRRVTLMGCLLLPTILLYLF